MQTTQYDQLKQESTQRLNDLIRGMAQLINQRYYTLDVYATKLLEALDSGNATDVEKAKDDLRRYLKNDY